MPFPLFESLVRQVDGPRRFLLNYSGESTVYPELIPAIRLARSTGAAVELVSALASAPDALLEPLASSGLTRLTVSIAADSAGFDVNGWGPRREVRRQPTGLYAARRRSERAARRELRDARAYEYRNGDRRLEGRSSHGVATGDPFISASVTTPMRVSPRTLKSANVSIETSDKIAR